MCVTSIFRPAGENLRILIVHSTENDLGKNTARQLRANLKAEIEVAEQGVSTLGDLMKLPRPNQGYHVVLLIAHGDKASNQVWLFGDIDVGGNDIGTNVALLKIALDGLLDNSLCLFGVCHFGDVFLKATVIDQGGALACIAPKPGCTISKVDIQCGFADLLNEIQCRKNIDVGVGDLHDLLNEFVSDELRRKLSVII